MDMLAIILTILFIIIMLIYYFYGEYESDEELEYKKFILTTDENLNIQEHYPNCILPKLYRTMPEGYMFIKNKQGVPYVYTPISSDELNMSFNQFIKHRQHLESEPDDSILLSHSNRY